MEVLGYPRVPLGGDAAMGLRDPAVVGVGQGVQELLPERLEVGATEATEQLHAVESVSPGVDRDRRPTRAGRFRFVRPIFA